MKTHYLKTTPEFFQDVKSGAKIFEVRLNDRDYQVGDTAVLQEWLPHTEQYSGDEITKKITYILDDKVYCSPGYVIMSLGDISDHSLVSLPILNCLKPTTVSCTFKVLEELGELVQLIGKHSGLSGETPTISEEVRIRRMVLESLDVAQAAITMAHTLCELHELSLESFIESHGRKLRQKGYLVNV